MALFSLLEPDSCTHDHIDDKGNPGAYSDYDSGKPNNPSGPLRSEQNGACTGIGEASACKEEPGATPSTTDELSALIGHLSYGVSWSQLNASRDVLMKRTIEIGISDLGRDGGAPLVKPDSIFVIESPAPPVECLEPVADGCKRVVLEAGSTIRFMHFIDTTRSILRILRRCSTPCASHELRCFQSSACFAKGMDFCQMCEGRGAKSCSCRDTECQPVLDGKRCSVSAERGVCSQGVCAVP